MKLRISRRTGFSAVAGILPFVALLSAACSDVGDSSAVGQDSGSSVTEDGSAPTTDGGQDGTVAQMEAGAMDSATAATDTGSPSADSSTGSDSASEDSGLVDSGMMADTNVESDSSVADSSVADSSVADSSVADSAVVDSGAADTSVAVDSGASDSSAPSEAGSGDASSPLVPCTTSGQTGCVQCQGNTTAASCTATTCICTATEAVLVQYDIAKGNATAPGPDPASSCYTCLFQAGSLDDQQFSDSNHECGDLAAADQADCLATMECVLSSSCATGAKPDVAACYCGTAPTSGSCTSGGANGACKAQEAAGLGFAVTDGLDILKNFTSTTLASGVANNIIQGAISNTCSACLK